MINKRIRKPKFEITGLEIIKKGFLKIQNPNRNCAKIAKVKIKSGIKITKINMGNIK